MALPQDELWCKVRVILLLSGSLRNQGISELGAPSFNQNTTWLFIWEKSTKQIGWYWQGLIFTSTKRCSRERLHQLIFTKYQPIESEVEPIAFGQLCEESCVEIQSWLDHIVAFYSDQLSG